MGYELNIPLGMMFRKMYCRHCGNNLKRHKIKNVYDSKDPNFERVMMRSIVNINLLTEEYSVWYGFGKRRILLYV